MATRIGLEPTTPSVTGWCSNQLSYRAMIAQVRAASYRGNVLYYIEKSVCCQAQICRKCNFLQKRAGWAVWRRQNDLKCAPRSLCASSAERIFIISRLSRSVERSKRYFHGWGRNGKQHLQRRFLRKRGAAGECLLPLGGAVAQRLRGYKWRSEKSVKAIAPTGAALAFLCFDFFFRIVKGE